MSAPDASRLLEPAYLAVGEPRRGATALPEANSLRFTLDGSSTLEEKLLRICSDVAAAVIRAVPNRKLEGLVLAGGYGRGEGGVLKLSGGDEPYNDLEFYVFLRGNPVLNELRYATKLANLGHDLSGSAGLDVELKVDSICSLRCRPVSMFSYDLVARHRLLLGDQRVFDGCDAHTKPDRIPASEATRLLLNRCTGLLLVKQILCESGRGSRLAEAKGDEGRPARQLTAAETDFIRRNLSKLQLALGDALLTAAERYHWSCRERHARLCSWSPVPATGWLQKVRELHALGLEFKLHPFRTSASAEELVREYHELSDLALEIWLWLESRRLKRPFSTDRDYALSLVEKSPSIGRWRHYLLNLRLFGIKACVMADPGRYPRERLFTTLPLLLWNEHLTKEPELVHHVQRQLGATKADWEDLMNAYRRVWPRFG